MKCRFERSEKIQILDCIEQTRERSRVARFHRSLREEGLADKELVN